MQIVVIYFWFCFFYVGMYGVVDWDRCGVYVYTHEASEY